MYKKRSLTNFILLALEKAADGYIRFDDLIHKPGYYAYGGGWDRPLKKSEFSQALERLREKGLIDFVDDEKLIMRLTKKGKQKAVLTSTFMDDQKWDGKWRLVIFDVPEKRRAARDVLRRKLKEWGFLHFQQSVWGTKKNCTKPLRDYIKSAGIEDWVMVVESDNIGNIGRNI